VQREKVIDDRILLDYLTVIYDHYVVAVQEFLEVGTLYWIKFELKVLLGLVLIPDFFGYHIRIGFYETGLPVDPGPIDRQVYRLLPYLLIKDYFGQLDLLIVLK
jgi:hypothetical protein